MFKFTAGIAFALLVNACASEDDAQSAPAVLEAPAGKGLTAVAWCDCVHVTAGCGTAAGTMCLVLKDPKHLDETLYPFWNCVDAIPYSGPLVDVGPRLVDCPANAKALATLPSPWASPWPY